ncbi:hypothetical protein [Laribacter hongkongensis]|uniref:hypothetical protein n=1 Tax=Laribacter hongkongensis TaxID=168471 RepID=UPI00041350EE|nr:hypothetical protein [Laribacter hongkongensis]
MRYRYTGPVSSILIDGKPTQLVTGAEIDLPEDSHDTIRLKSLGVLVPLDAAPPTRKKG